MPASAMCERAKHDIYKKKSISESQRSIHKRMFLERPTPFVVYGFLLCFLDFSLFSTLSTLCTAASFCCAQLGSRIFLCSLFFAFAPSPSSECVSRMPRILQRKQLSFFQQSYFFFRYETRIPTTDDSELSCYSTRAHGKQIFPSLPLPPALPLGSWLYEGFFHCAMSLALAAAIGAPIDYDAAALLRRCRVDSDDVFVEPWRRRSSTKNVKYKVLLCAPRHDGKEY